MRTFCAACLIDLDSTNNQVGVWNGGIPDVLVYTADGVLKKRIKSSHLPLGVVNNGSIDISHELMEVHEDDRIYIYSDGVIEAANADGEMFGQARLELFFADNTQPDRLFDEIQTGLSDYCVGSEQQDDITLIEISHKPVVEDQFKSKLGDSTFYKVSSEWEVVLELGHDTLKAIDPLPSIIHVLLEVQGLYRHRGRIYTILSELFANALEHGVLKLDSAIKHSPEGFAEYYQRRESALDSLDEGWVRIKLANKPLASGGRLTINIEDSGPGFEMQSATFAGDNSSLFCGRGINLVKSLCEEVRYSNNGKCVEAIYLW